ncbi:MAG: carbohydrate porin, partial [Steroidobacteraceae bacterium]|nr:carbohydrate porin [Steroidobacteraceae bacterium]MDW8258471.1 carbohydrate porin [Gammaproteobacteria bacterium]
LNSSHGVAPTLAQTGLNGPSIFPITSLALRWRGASERLTWQLALFDAVPGDRDNPAQFGVHLSGREGALLIGEIGAAVPGWDKLAVGAWTYSERFAPIDDDGSAAPQRGNDGLYLIGETTLLERGERKLRAFVRLGHASARFNPIDFYAGAGLTWHGLLPRRPDDRFGLAVAFARNSDRFRRFAAASGAPVERAETAVELTWRAPLGSWLTLQPNLQYVRNPGMRPDLDDALVVALRFELNASLLD